jgi:hypothetical protein
MAKASTFVRQEQDAAAIENGCLASPSSLRGLRELEPMHCLTNQSLVRTLPAALRPMHTLKELPFAKECCLQATSYIYRSAEAHDLFISLAEVLAIGKIEKDGKR